ncbi:MAG: tRNA epoxyqueuosine(34) reductase QueG [Sphingobacteriia bacterium]
MTGESLIRKLRQQALRLGFDALGVSPAAELSQDARYLERWLAAGRQGEMHYLDKHFDLRIDPRKLHPGTQTVVSVLKNYYPPELPEQADGFRVAAYAYGQDYHQVLKERLYALAADLSDWVGRSLSVRVCTDSAPILERRWAERAGLGWIGKNTLLLTRQGGSWYFLGELLVDLALPAEHTPQADHCGTCTRCLDACPTGALSPYEMDARKCISYHTIELKAQVPVEFHRMLSGWAFGCDICQEVCPWTRFAQPHTEPAFRLTELVAHYAEKDWQALSSSQYRKRTRTSPLSRIRREKLLENIALAKASRSI